MISVRVHTVLSRIFTGTALFFAVENGDKAIVELLLRYGASSTTLNWRGQTPLESARNHGYEEIVTILENISEN